MACSIVTVLRAVRRVYWTMSQAARASFQRTRDECGGVGTKTKTKKHLKIQILVEPPKYHRLSTMAISSSTCSNAKLRFWSGSTQKVSHFLIQHDNDTLKSVISERTTGIHDKLLQLDCFCYTHMIRVIGFHQVHIRNKLVQGSLHSGQPLWNGPVCVFFKPASEVLTSIHTDWNKWHPESNHSGFQFNWTIRSWCTCTLCKENWSILNQFPWSKVNH